jgi:hypothetical protein
MLASRAALHACGQSFALKAENLPILNSAAVMPTFIHLSIAGGSDYDRWRDDRTIVTVEITDPHYRAVRVETNAEEVTRVSRVRIGCDDGPPLTLMFDRP